MTPRPPKKFFSVVGAGIALAIMALNPNPAAAGSLYECGEGTAVPSCPRFVRVVDRSSGDVAYQCGAGTPTPVCPAYIRVPAHPVPPPETCNGVDDNGNGWIDDGNLCPAGYSCQGSHGCLPQIPTAPAGPTDSIRGDWSLGVGAFALSAPSGPTALGAEATLIGDLRVADGWYFHVSAAPGGASVDGEASFSLSEFAGFQRRFESFSLTGGARHRVAFLEGDNLNALLGEAQLRIFLGDSFALALFGGAGWGMFPVEEPQQGLFPAGESVPTITESSSGFTWSAALGGEYRF